MALRGGVPSLSEVERNQRALDRYLRSRKTPWQLGRDYERYIGYVRELVSARVTYQGIFAGLEDLGRDLLAERDGVIEVIQCKRWSESPMAIRPLRSGRGSPWFLLGDSLEVVACNRRTTLLAKPCGR